ncbi:MAG: hypothetical protein DSZ28_02985 [Thiothrix sp.]|nr:MAG: hypothetical protein DSZ28_02985 [Thiothrix sp.]
MMTESYDAGVARSRLILFIGALAAILGAAGVLAISPLLVYLIPKLVNGEYSYLFNLALFQFMWAVFFVSLLVAGIKLVISGANRKRYDIIPGLTLYFLGAALMVNGFLMLMYGHVIYAGIAILVGSIVSYLEWSTEVV